ncbi:MAG: 50S ribosomal protein L15e [Candidatus Marsarchaeota archaeon]|nr:50S ribosomal protein L15e [Candidatus Marsarchaeota archaeon]MCL5102029.1 50S ribosomal protein L15e [Candidatus Marsarchaeota archaeon]
MGANKYIRETLIKEYKERSPEYKNKLAEWTKQDNIVKIERPSNLARARALGYKAKEGIIIARASVRKGNRKRPAVGGGRKPSKSARFISRHKSMQVIAEERVSKRFSNYEVLNSYFVGETGTDRFYEVILVSKQDKSVAKDRVYASIANQNGRAHRSLTSAGKKARGL